MTTNNDSTRILRRSLRGNAAFSSLSGFVFLFFSKQLDTFMGVGNAMVFSVVGGLLVIFAIGLFLSSKRSDVSLVEAVVAIAMDLGWVAGSVIIFSMGILSSGGNILLIVIAGVVLMFALLQWIGVSRVRGNSLKTDTVLS